MGAYYSTQSTSPDGTPPDGKEAASAPSTASAVANTAAVDKTEPSITTQQNSAPNQQEEKKITPISWTQSVREINGILPVKTVPHVTGRMVRKYPDHFKRTDNRTWTAPYERAQNVYDMLDKLQIENPQQAILDYDPGQMDTSEIIVQRLKQHITQVAKRNRWYIDEAVLTQKTTIEQIVAPLFAPTMDHTMNPSSGTVTVNLLGSSPSNGMTVGAVPSKPSVACVLSAHSIVPILFYAAFPNAPTLRLREMQWSDRAHAQSDYRKRECDDHELGVMLWLLVQKRVLMDDALLIHGRQ